LRSNNAIAGISNSTARLANVSESEKTTFKHRIAEVHAISMKRLSKVEAADDPSDGAAAE
jgi:hypothetical protein